MNPPDHIDDHGPDQVDGDDVLDMVAAGLSEREPLPDRLREAALSAYTWHNVDAELAQLVYDSIDGELVATRSSGGSRRMAFGAPGVDIEISVDGDRRRVVGQLIPPDTARVELVAGDRVLTTEADDIGRFRFLDVENGPIRISVVSTTTDRTIHTEWVFI